jgi:pyruvate formate lyase activating enzyme
VHFTAFHPDYKMLDTPPTPPATLTRARCIGIEEGLRFVYTGNVHDAEGGSTWCPGCGSAVVVRDWYAMRHYALTDDGRCRACGCQLAGVYDGPAGHWGRRRLPLLTNLSEM